MAIHVKPIGPMAPNAPVAPASQESLRMVRQGAEALGGANNYAAQSTVQGRQDTEARKQVEHLIDRKITTATLAALAPVGSAHDEDEADAEREQDAFGSEWFFELKGQPKKVTKKKPGPR
jgi:acetyl-CoA carboxylase carboxyltransferase component